LTQTLALLLSIAVEAPVATAVVAFVGLGRPSRAALAAVVATLLTHGFAWRGILLASESFDWATTVIAAEVLVILVEAVVYRSLADLSVGGSMATSCVANAASTLFGIGLWRLGIG
jgi:hypothetical protein